VLIGNLDTAQTFHALRKSSTGWSDVGLSLGHSLGSELDQLMHHTVTKLTGTLTTIIQVETDIDHVLGTVAHHTDKHISALKKSTLWHHKSDAKAALSESSDSEVSSLLQSTVEVCEDKSVDDELASLLQGKVHMQVVGLDASSGASSPKHEAGEEKKMPEETRMELHKLIKHLVENVKDGVHKLLKLLKPALLQIGKWLHSMGPKMQGTIEEFSIVIDRVQKLIDEVMAKIAGPGLHSAALLENVFDLFDVDGSGYVNADDMHKVSILYGITALQHMKGEQLLKKYDANKDTKLSKQEFALMVRDESIPKAPTMILRTFSRKLSEVAGAVSAARQRDEVAHSVVQYFTLVSAKNKTKVSWVSQALTNSTLPLEFVADVLKQFAQNADNPGIVTVVDVGAITVQEMVKLNSHLVARALKLMADPKWWHHSGFDAADQSKVVKRVAHWVAQAGGHAEAALLLQTGTVAAGVSTASLVDLVQESVRSNSRQFAAQQRSARANELEARMSSDTSVGLFRSLLGSQTLARVGTDPDVARVVKAGVHAKADTLQFAQWLARNASATAARFQHLCFDHAHTSSNAVDSLATQIQGMLKKTQNFLRLMQRYSTPHGIEALEARVNKFMDHAVDELLGVVDTKIDAELAKLGADLPGNKKSQVGLFQDENLAQGMWKDVIKFTKDLKGTLPTVIDDMKFAKQEVAKVSANMLSTFPVLKTKGLPIFEHMQSMYTAMWVSYFVTFVILNIGVLFFGFWASGYFGGPAAAEEGGAPPDSHNRLRVCFQACTACLDSCPNSKMCYWSAMMLASAIVLFMFALSTVLSLLCGLKLWVSSGCDEVYLLSDNTICSEVMGGIQSWLSTFWSPNFSHTSLESMCVSETLMTCSTISGKMKESAVFTAGGSLLAAVLTCQMLFESARLYEQARWRQIVQEKTMGLADQD